MLLLCDLQFSVSGFSFSELAVVFERVCRTLMCSTPGSAVILYSKNPLIRNPFLKISLFCFLYKGAISRNSPFCLLTQYIRNFSMFDIFISCI